MALLSINKITFNLSLAVFCCCRWPLKSLFLVNLVGGLGGYYMTLLMQGFAYISDITTLASRGMRWVERWPNMSQESGAMIFVGSSFWICHLELLVESRGFSADSGWNKDSFSQFLYPQLFVELLCFWSVFFQIPQKLKKKEIKSRTCPNAIATSHSVKILATSFRNLRQRHHWSQMVSIHKSS